MFSLREAGLIRFLAISEAFAADTAHTMVREAISDGPFDVIMVGMNFVNQTALREVLPAASDQDIGIQCMYAVRKHLRELRTADNYVRRLVLDGEVDADDLDPSPLGFLFDGGASSLPDACYRFNRHAVAGSVLTGTGSDEHLVQNLASIVKPALSSVTMHRLQHIFRNVRKATAG